MLTLKDNYSLSQFGAILIIVAILPISNTNIVLYQVNYWDLETRQHQKEIRRLLNRQPDNDLYKVQKYTQQQL